jgi:antitoxin component YwqK of YwqJK toxin-antitoxin module
MKILRSYNLGLNDQNSIIFINLNEKCNTINGKREGIIYSYSNDGNIFTQSSHINDLLYGINIEYYHKQPINEQKISYICYYKDDKRYGKYYSYYLNRRLDTMNNYDNGYIIGKEIKYYDTGMIKSIAYYNKGLKIGKEKLFFKSGELNQEFNYLKGRINEKNIVYYKTGQIKRISNYLDGVLHGISELYEKNGKIIKTIKYLDGNIIRS